MVEKIHSLICDSPCKDCWISMRSSLHMAVDTIVKMGVVHKINVEGSLLGDQACSGALEVEERVHLQAEEALRRILYILEGKNE